MHLNRPASENNLFSQAGRSRGPHAKIGPIKGPPASLIILFPSQSIEEKLKIHFSHLSPLCSPHFLSSAHYNLLSSSLPDDSREAMAMATRSGSSGGDRPDPSLSGPRQPDPRALTLRWPAVDDGGFFGRSGGSGRGGERLGRQRRENPLPPGKRNLTIRHSIEVALTKCHPLDWPYNNATQ